MRGEQMRFKPSLIAMGLLALALAGAACGGDGSDAANTAEAARTIEVTALDELAYDPASIEVDAGETVTFIVTNAGANEHEFVVGDAEMQEMAEKQAMEGEHGHVEAMASLALSPGETSETTVTFEDTGEILYACHVASHYDGGMVGTITVG
jgi:uncharacterized cupredoxin-like copper-binding protein